MKFFATLLVCSIAAGLAFASSVALAQDNNGDLPGVKPPLEVPPPGEQGVKPEAEDDDPPPPPPKAENLPDTLDELFALLKRQRDPKKAEKISGKIWEKWYESGSKSVDLLTGWAKEASSKKKYGVALDLLDQIIVLRPDYAEGWNQRATLHYVMSNYSKSVADIERTLALEPRHYGALSGMAAILQVLGRKKEALEIWHRVLTIYPAMQNAQKAVIKLEDELTGRGI